jgi:hypothetical protein
VRLRPPTDIIKYDSLNPFVKAFERMQKIRKIQPSILDIIKIATLTYCVFSYLLLAAGALGLISPLTITILTLLTAATGIFLKKKWRPTPSKEISKKWLLWSVYGLAFVLYAHVLLYPVFVRDDLIYHLLVPKRLLQSGALRLDYNNLASSFPMLFEYPLVLPLMFKSWWSPFSVNLVVVFGIAISCMAMAIRHFRVSVFSAALLGLAVIATPVVYDLSQSAYVELFLALLVLLAVDEWLEYQQHGGGIHHIYLACLFLGLSAGAKYLGLIYGAVAITYFYFQVEQRRTAYIGAVIFVLAASPWYLKNFIFTGNPVFPFAPWLFPNEHLSIRRSIYFEALYADYGLGSGWLNHLLVPFYLLAGMDKNFEPGIGGFDGRLSLLLGFVVMSFSRQDRRTHLACLFFLAFGSIWILGSQQARFLVAAVVPAVVVGFGRLSEKFPSKKIATTLAAVAFIHGIGIIIWQTSLDGRSDFVSGKLTEEEFFEMKCAIPCNFAKKINTVLNPKSSKILAIGEFGKNYYYDAQVVTKTYFETEMIEAAFEKRQFNPDIWETYLNKEGITHLQLKVNTFTNLYAQDETVDAKEFIAYLKKTTRLTLKQGDTVLLTRLNLRN